MNKNKRFVSIMAGLMAAVMLLTLIVGLIPTRASAQQSSSEIRNQINDLKQQKADIEKEIKAIKEQYKEMKTKLPTWLLRKMSSIMRSAF